MNGKGKRARMRGQVEVVVSAPATAVWEVVADVTRTGEWSHECHDVRWLHNATRPAPGVRFRGRNRSGWLRWTRTCELTAVEAPRCIAWRTITSPLFVDSTDWTITLEPVTGGTRIVQTYQVTKCPRWWEWIVVHINPPHIDRTAALTTDLHRLGQVAAATSPVGNRPSKRPSTRPWRS